MALFLFYDDQWLDAQQPLITAANRGFRYGDGLFETLYVADGAIRLHRYHFARLLAGMRLLQLRLPEKYDAAYLSGRIAALCEKNHHPAARVRLTVFRGDGHLFDDPAAPAHCIIESLPLPAAPPAAGERVAGSNPVFPTSELRTPNSELLTGIFPHARKAADAYSHLKSNNYLPSAMAALYARQQGWNDALVLNAAGRVCESAIANVFIVRGGRLYTPPLSEGCVAGVMRQWMLDHLPGAGYAIEEKPVSVDELYAADEVFLTNALHPLRPVGRCDEAQYGASLSAGILQAMNVVNVEMWKM